MESSNEGQSKFRKILISFLKNPTQALLDFNELKSKGILDSPIVKLEEINLWGCKFDNTEIPKRIENFFFEQVVFSHIVYNGTITFTNCVFGNDTDIHQGRNDVFFTAIDAQMLYISNCKIKGRIIVLSNKLDSFYFDFCKGKGELLLSDCNIRYVGIRSSILNKESLTSVTFKETQGIESIMIRDIFIESIGFEGEMCKDVFIGDGNYDNINFNGSGPIGDFRIEFSQNVSSFLKIGKIQLWRKHLEGDFQLNFIVVRKLFFDEIKSIDKSLSLRGVTVTESFQFKSSTIDKTFWNNVDFSSAKLIFDYSFFKELKYANIQWGKNDFGITTEEKGVLRLKILTEVFRQLKIIAGNNQNVFDKLKLQRLEYLNYWERVKQDKTENKYNRFLLRIDRIFSNFGQDYLRPLIWLLGVQLVLFTIIWIREDCYHNYNATSYQAAFENGLSQFASMVIPLFKIPDYWTGTSISISILIRLFNALMIYYFIRAVHKFGRSN